MFVRSLSGAKKGEGASGKEGPSDIVCRRGLNRLCEAKPAYLRRLHYRNRKGAWLTVYATAPLGRAIGKAIDQGQEFSLVSRRWRLVVVRSAPSWRRSSKGKTSPCGCQGADSSVTLRMS